MQLPNADRAVVDIAKLGDYLLGATHLRGRHKAPMFSASPGMTAADAAHVCDAVLRIDATEMDSDRVGRRFVADFALSHGGRTAEIRTT